MKFNTFYFIFGIFWQNGSPKTLLPILCRYKICKINDIPYTNEISISPETFYIIISIYLDVLDFTFFNILLFHLLSERWVLKWLTAATAAATNTNMDF